MNIVAQKETKENSGVQNKSIRHLHDESSRMENRLIEFCGETYEDIYNGTDNEHEELFNQMDYTIDKDDESMNDEQDTVSGIPDNSDKRDRRQYSDIAKQVNRSIRMRMSFRG